MPKSSTMRLKFPTTMMLKTLNKKDYAAYGMGGGVFVAWLNASAGVRISNTTIQKNKAAVGGGVASYGPQTKMDIDDCTITENNATDYGGGFAAKQNTSGGQTTIKRTVKAPFCATTLRDKRLPMYIWIARR